MSRRTGALERRRRLAAALRLLAGLALLVLATALFRGPFAAVLGPRLAPLAAALPLPVREPRQAASGFLLQVTSTPSGAAVLVDGGERGRTPALLNVVCSAGQSVSLVVRRAGYAEDARTLPCQDGRTVDVHAALRR